MPQKKNPDAAELLRAKAPRVVAHLVALHGVMHGLPLTYNKDMQEDKEHLFDAVDTLELCLAGGARDARGRSRSTASGSPRAAADELIAATDVADLLVRRGVPFRAVARDRRRARARGASTSGRSLSELTREELARHSDALDDEFYDGALAARRGSSRRSPRAAPRWPRVREQLAHARAELDGQPA